MIPAAVACLLTRKARLSFLSNLSIARKGLSTIGTNSHLPSSPLSSSFSSAADPNSLSSDNPQTPHTPPSLSCSNDTAQGNNSIDTRTRVLSLYRSLLRASEKMPTPNRRKYVMRKTKAEFRKHMALTDKEEIDFHLRLADTNLDTVMVQAEHLSRLFNDPDYQNYN